MKKIYVCGKEGSGKTTIAVNLALELQKSGKRTALVDMNLHSPHASLCFGITPHKTLNDFLDGAAEFSEIIHRHESGLDIVLSSLKRFETDADLHRIEKDLESNFRNHDFATAYSLSRRLTCLQS
jgi:MinD-like ATPase involved in chromosome partitioning or flagellar assembly